MGDLVERVYVGPFVGERADGSVLTPGDVVEVSEQEAESGWYADPSATPEPPAVEPEPEPVEPPAFAPFHDDGADH